MISFWRQLRFLLWKAYLIKWRQKFWLTVEVIVPLLLFTMLALIRTRDFSDPRPLCHYDSKGMMSAGMLPFFHSIFCSFENTCNRQPTTGDEGTFFNNGTAKNEIVDLLYYGALQLRQIGTEPEVFNNTVEQIVKLITLLANMNTTELEPVKITELLNLPESDLSSLFEGFGATPSMSKILAGSSITTAFATYSLPLMFQAFFNRGSFPDALQNFTSCIEDNSISLLFEDQVDCALNLNMLCDSSMFDESFKLPNGSQMTIEDRKSLCNLKPKTDALWKLNDMRKNFSSNSNVHQFNGSINTLLDLFNSIQSLLSWAQAQPLAQVKNFGSFLGNYSSISSALFCGKNPLDINMDGLQPTPQGAETPFNKLKDKLVAFLKTVTPGKEKHHDKEFCGKVPVRMDTNCSQIENLMIAKLRPIIQGYILVSPSSPAVRRLVKRLEEPLRNIDALRRLFAEWPGMADSVQDALHQSDFWPASQNALTYITKMFGPIVPPQIERLEFLLQHLFNNSSDPYSFGAITKNLTATLSIYTKCIATDRFFVVDSEDEMENSATCLTDYEQYFTGISFINHTSNATNFDPFVTYKIRQVPDLVDGTNGIMDGRRPFSRDSPFNDLKYLTFGFSFLQESVDRALIEEITGKNASVGAFAQQQPFPCVTQDIFNVSNFLGLCIILSFIIPAALLVKNIVLEKELKLKEQMRIMGLGDAVHFVSWALASLVLNFLSVLAITLILRYGRVLRQADVSLLLVVLLLFALSSISMSLFVSTLFSNANMATAATTIIYFLFLFPFQLSVKTKSSAFSKFTLIFPQTVICYAAKMIAEQDVWADGAKWKYMHQLYLEEYDVSLAQCMIALACETVGFWILSWYLSAIFPGVYGVSQPWYFPLTKSYWFPAAEYHVSNDADPEFDKIYASDMFEHDPTDQKMTVRIAGLTKIYSNGTKALNGLYMRLYEGQITALLGHNGAGKTTTMSMLCGLYSPSSGMASVYGRDLRREMRRVRDVLGVCPQQNVLFAHLTVREQLCFFAALKGTDPKQLYAAANEILEAVCLTEKADSLAGTLSGGQKRRLCIGIALIGGSQFVILDEPTAGVDVNSRKDIWRLLQKNKTGRTILLSTHHMDEADVLSDRVAVLSEGQLVTLGSPVFLKRRFGECLQLVACKMDKKGSYEVPLTRIVNDSPLKGSIKVQDTNEDEIMFSIPIETDSILLERFFTWFEAAVQDLRFSDYGISAPTLQQIFIRLAPQREYNVPKEYKGCFSSLMAYFRRRRANVQTDQTALIPVVSAPQLGLTPANSAETVLDNEYDFEPPPPVTGFKKTKEHVKALLACRAHYTKRNKKTLLFEVVLPVALLLAAEVYAILALPSSKQLITVSQAPLPIASQIVSYRPDSYVNLWDQNTTELGQETYSHGIVESLVTDPGMGTICAEGAPEALYIAECTNMSSGEWIWDEPDNSTYNADLICECSNTSRWNCTMEDYPLWEQNHVELNTTDRIWDFSGKNLSQFTMDTIQSHNGSKYRPSFLGGFSLGHHSIRAASPSQIKAAQSGWQIALQDFALAASEIGLNLTGIKGNSSLIIDAFSQNITLTNLVDTMVANLDVEENVKLWFNNKIWPSYPIYLNAMSNALLRMLSPDYDPEKLGILTINHPMNQTVNEALNNNAMQKLITFRIILILMVLCTVPAGFTVFLVEDRNSGSLHMQMVSGLRKSTYWLTGYVFDFLIYFLSCVTILLIYLIFGVKEFSFSAEVFFSYLLLFVLYGLTAILWAYILQRKFTIAALSFILISIGTFFLGAISTLTVIIIEQLMQTDPTMATSHKVCSSIFLILPQYNLGMAIFRGAAAYQLMVVGKQFLAQVNRMDLADQLPIPGELDWDMMGLYCTALLAHVFVAFLVLIVLEHGSFGFLRRREKSHAAALMITEKKDDDDDVQRERLRVDGLLEGESPLIVRDLTKAFSKQQLAVKGVSFAVDGGECFGLLGLNGAGKTTTFGMLTGKIYASGGTVAINGSLVERGASVAFAQVGYCPQFDALNPMLTTKENLVFFARIRAIPEEAIEDLADRLLKALHLRPYSKTLTSALSGGNKRKLSVAIALISQPSLILLDEPSAGMDPGSQQFLWKVIEKLRKSGKAVVMTSHSMEECEALCTRIAIMDRGKIRCLGSKQHLKNKFGEGYSLTLKLVTLEEIDPARVQVKHELPVARLEAIHCTTLFYHIDREATSIAEILKAVNRVKAHVQMEDFSLSQSTLDDVFQTLSQRSESTSIVSVPSVGQLTQSTNISNE